MQHNTSSWKRWLSHYPLTWGGTLLVAVSVYMMGRGYTDENGYALILSMIALVLLILLVVDGYIQSYRLGHIQLIWDQGELPVARQDGFAQTIHLGEVKAHPFFRIHFLIQGRLQAGRDAWIYLTEEGSVSHGGEVSIPFRFPVSGTLHVRGRMFIRDVFGFVRIPTGRSELRTIHIRPPVIAEKPGMNYDSLLSLEVSRNKIPADEEKFYMRQYQAGDRMKDINWKASMRVLELITRISPLSPEQSKVIHVELRNVSYMKKDTPVSVAHLNYLKSWMLSFMHSVKRRYPEFRFRVISSAGVEELESHEDINRYGGTIAALTYVSAESYYRSEEIQDTERFIFTTMYDRNLSADLSDDSSIRYHVFRTVSGSANSSARPRRIRLFRDQGKYRTSVGPWILRIDKTVPVGIRTGNGGSLVEESLKVKRL